MTAAAHAGQSRGARFALYCVRYMTARHDIHCIATAQVVAGREYAHEDVCLACFGPPPRGRGLGAPSFAAATSALPLRCLPADAAMPTSGGKGKGKGKGGGKAAAASGADVSGASSKGKEAKDGERLVGCKQCPMAFHPACAARLGLEDACAASGNFPHGPRRLVARCPHHACDGCERSAGAAGGMLFRCEACVACYCEVCRVSCDVNALYCNVT